MSTSCRVRKELDFSTLLWGLGFDETAVESLRRFNIRSQSEFGFGCGRPQCTRRNFELSVVVFGIPGENRVFLHQREAEFRGSTLPADLCGSWSRGSHTVVVDCVTTHSDCTGRGRSWLSLKFRRTARQKLRWRSLSLRLQVRVRGVCEKY